MVITELIEKANKVLAESGDLRVFVDIDIVGFGATQAINRPAKLCWLTHRYNSASKNMDDIFEIVGE